MKGGKENMEKPYKYQKKLVRVGGSDMISIPATWLKQLAEKLGEKVIGIFDMLIYKDYIEIRPAQD